MALNPSNNSNLEQLALMRLSTRISYLRKDPRISVLSVALLFVHYRNVALDCSFGRPKKLGMAGTPYATKFVHRLRYKHSPLSVKVFMQCRCYLIDNMMIQVVDTTIVITLQTDNSQLNFMPFE